MRLLFMLTLISFVATVWVADYLRLRNAASWVDPPRRIKFIATNQ